MGPYIRPYSGPYRALLGPDIGPYSGPYRALLGPYIGPYFGPYFPMLEEMERERGREAEARGGEVGEQ